jgi:hypothetical protein
MVPLEVMPLATGLVEWGLLEEKVVLFEAAAARVALFACVGLGLTVTVVKVVLEKWTVEVARAGAALMVVLLLLLFLDNGEAVAVFRTAVERFAPVAWATPADFVLFENSATVALAREVLEEFL